MIYQNWTYHTFPVAMMSVASVWCFARYVRTKRIAFVCGSGTLLALLALTRSSYHLAFVIIGAAAIVVAAPKLDRRRVLVAVGIPLLVVAGLYVKNDVMFGEPAASSWLGMNLAHSLLGNQPDAVRARTLAARQDRRARRWTPRVPRPRLLPVPSGADGRARPRTGPRRRPRVNNYNNLAYIDVSRQYQKG